MIKYGGGSRGGGVSRILLEKNLKIIHIVLENILSSLFTNPWLHP
jgi:hypothetical protein